MSARFVLQFEAGLIDELAERYGPHEDAGALAAGKRIADGDFSRETLKIIVRWKSVRRAGLIDENSEGEIAKALRFATDVRTSERSAVATLDRLHGVGIPMASAILTTIAPERYTVIDFRALESLGVREWPNDSVDYYLEYLAACRDLARRCDKPLRTIDRALWQWSKEHPCGD
jgi:hypothetical protein